MSYCGKALRVDLTTGSIWVETLPEELLMGCIGGRGLNMVRLYDEVPPEVDALSPQNKLFIGVGPLTGTAFPGSGRVNISSKSPQTGKLGDSNAGGFFGPELKFAGFDQVIVEGKAPKLCYLLIKDGGAEIRPAGHLAGMEVFDAQEAIRQELGDAKVQVATIGLAAENGVKYSGVFCNLVRAAARTGMGAVMASKNLKAVAIRGTGGLVPADRAKVEELLAVIHEQISSHAEFQPRIMLGTTRLVHALNEAGCLATRHFQTGRFEGAEQVSGEYLAEKYKKKGKGCFSCTIPCSRYFELTDGQYKGLKSEGPEFEGLAGFSSRVGVSDIGAALKGVDLCNRYGMDVISTSECISFAMEMYQRGMITQADTGGLDLVWGNSEAVLTLITQIAHRQGFGDLLADGVVKAAERLGADTAKYAMHVKGLEIFQADPRGLKGYALGVAVATRGGDHLRAEPSFEFTENAEEGVRRFGAAESAFRLEHKGKGKVVKFYEERCVLADSLNVCKNTVVNMEILSFAEAAELLKADTGLPFTEEGLQRSAERIMNVERAYIAREGVRRQDDTLPERFLKEPLPAECGPSAGSVVELEPMLDEYYAARKWDSATGLPTKEGLDGLGLHRIAADLTKRGIL
ncbi:MAG: aldehyde ferredoxin oxidoreductase family protein [Negativicutes bacterium]|nr:aldehyde ferredoxin oxidoreductase family protein [Negativicutes bacterium]